MTSAILFVVQAQLSLPAFSTLEWGLAPCKPSWNGLRLPSSLTSMGKAEGRSWIAPGGWFADEAQTRQDSQGNSPLFGVNV